MFDILHIEPVLFTYENDWIIYNHNINYTKKKPTSYGKLSCNWCMYWIIFTTKAVTSEQIYIFHIEKYNQPFAYIYMISSENDRYM